MATSWVFMPGRLTQQQYDLRRDRCTLQSLQQHLDSPKVKAWQERNREAARLERQGDARRKKLKLAVCTWLKRLGVLAVTMLGILVVCSSFCLEESQVHKPVLSTDFALTIVLPACLPPVYSLYLFSECQMLLQQQLVGRLSHCPPSQSA